MSLPAAPTRKPAASAVIAAAAARPCPASTTASTQIHFDRVELMLHFLLLGLVSVHTEAVEFRSTRLRIHDVRPRKAGDFVGRGRSTVGGVGGLPGEDDAESWTEVIPSRFD